MTFCEQLNEYIKAIHFDDMKVPFVPFYKSSSRTYYGKVRASFRTCPLFFMLLVLLNHSFYYLSF